MKKCPHCGQYDLLDFQKTEIEALQSYRKGITSADVKGKLGLSIQNASNRLKKWFEAGYLIRRAEVDPSGGVIYRYFPSKVKP